MCLAGMPYRMELAQSSLEETSSGNSAKRDRLLAVFHARSQSWPAEQNTTPGYTHEVNIP